MVKLFFFFLKTAGVSLDEQEMHKVSWIWENWASFFTS